LRLISYAFLVSGIGVELHSIDFGKDFSIVNVYGPYEEIILSLEDLLDQNFLIANKVMLGGDLNFTFKRPEFSVNASRRYPLADFCYKNLRGKG
jgi:hypothetical protein